MNPVLIYTDNARIAREQKFLTDCVPVFQSIYNALTAFGITVTLGDVNSLVSLTKKGNGGPNFEQEFVINKLLDAATYNVNGITVSREGMRTIMVFPDVTPVKLALQGVGYLYSSNPQIEGGVELNLLTLTDGVIAKADNADATIAANYTDYTTSDASATLATSLQAVCDALNTHNTSNNNAMVVGSGFSTKNLAQLDIPLKGIAVVGGVFVPSLSYIRQFELTGSLFQS